MNDTLEARVMDAPDARDGTPVLVLMHGRGADPSDLASLRSWLPDRLTLVLPRAPFPGGPWGYGPGWAWYRYLGDDRPEPDSFSAAQEALAGLLSGLGERLGYTPGTVLLGGFSQGGTMSIGYALRNPGAVPAVINLSGFVPGHPDVPVTAESVRGTAFFWGHGTQDPAVGFHLAERGRAALAEAGAELDAHDYAMGHAISPDELRDVVEFMERIL